MNSHGFDLDFRPGRFWDSHSPVRDMLVAGIADEAPDEEDAAEILRLFDAHMYTEVEELIDGWSFWDTVLVSPACTPGEIVIASLTSLVGRLGFSAYVTARPATGGVAYRVYTDGSAAEEDFGPEARQSGPTMGQVHLSFGSDPDDWDPLEHPDPEFSNIADLLKAESVQRDFYPDLIAFHEATLRHWWAESRTQRETEQ